MDAILILSALLLLAGLRALIKNRVNITKNSMVSGKRVRIAGLLLIAPAIFNLIWTVPTIAAGPPGIRQSSLKVFFIVPIVVSAICIIAAITIVLTGEKMEIE